MSDQTIEQIHGLIDDDPWRTPQDNEVQQANDIQQRIHDRLEREGFFTEKPFVDPPDDADPTITDESSLTQFWRLKIDGKRLIQIIDLEPTIKKVALSFKNISSGCWFAFTGRRIAARMEDALNAHGILTELSNCDIKGQQINE